MKEIFYKPEKGVAADFIPFYWNGVWHLFFLHDYRDTAAHGEGVPWRHVTTKDFIHFEDFGEAIPRGTKDEQDLCVFTGSIFEHDGIFHAFYTGENRYFRERKKPAEVILHAVSRDLIKWEKNKSFAFHAPVELGYEPDDWRDPFVFKIENENKFGMLVTARKNNGPTNFRGCIVFASSPDLINWKVEKTLWAPDCYYAIECSDLFKMDDKYYLVYSAFSESPFTHYRFADLPAGPWKRSREDTFDGPMYYAAKTAFDGKKRFLFGWVATKEGGKDTGKWQWGGNLVVHEIRKHKDDSLVVRMPRKIRESFARKHNCTAEPLSGNWKIDKTKNNFSAFSIARRSVLSLGILPDPCLIEMYVSYQKCGAVFGLLINGDKDFNSTHVLKFDASQKRMTITKMPAPNDSLMRVEKQVDLKVGRSIQIRVCISGSCIVAYVDDEIALSGRIYEPAGRQLGLFATDGNVFFNGVSVKVLPDSSQ